MGNYPLILLGLTIFQCFGTSIAKKRFQESRGTPMQKVQLTQKGYIQFLRWELPVPEIREFTFCLWMESNDLTHAHPIFSYSRNEKERLVRSWISPRGRSIHLEIGGRRVLGTSIDILENRWYHFCLSWESKAGRYGLWVNGQLQAEGHSDQTRGHAIPGGGDIVLGQEYTDFDKGLDDGIEGSVFGFNLLLASAFEPLDISNSDTIRLPFGSSYASGVTQRGIDYTISNESRHLEELPLGYQLIRLSYVHCEIGRGSPFIGGPLMLISWTRTPVRIFGGAALKNIDGGCDNL
ncbi:pentraxin-4 [Xylocopa sonorina]|uniref:pentraxin-4 n=1 Tax=Xylocopa sonorina TaxID=1818115 RepID=UPI00403ADF5C